MGNRFSLCFFSGKYSVVDSSHNEQNNIGSGENVLAAIALELDEDESENPGLILEERF